MKYFQIPEHEQKSLDCRPADLKIRYHTQTKQHNSIQRFGYKVFIRCSAIVMTWGVFIHVGSSKVQRLIMVLQQ